MMEKCFKISGRVQGVGFRYWVLYKAAFIGGLSGYARNMDDGDVVVYVSGDENCIMKLQAALYDGPIFARVDTVQEAPECKSYFPPIQNGVFKRI
jgi:acylphosphatase